MSVSAYFVVQSFTRANKGGLRPDVPVQAQSPDHALRLAERLASQKAAVVAFMGSGDAQTGDYDDPKLIAAYGSLPDEIAEMPRA